MRSSSVLSLAAALASLALSACRCDTDVFHRMQAQPKYLPYQESELFEDGRAMRVPPAGTVPRKAPWYSVPPEAAEAKEGQALVRIPLEVTPSLLARGRDRFEIYCAACHGILGDGDSVVARKMPLQPPNLLALAGRPVGWYFDIVTLGSGLMPSYRRELPTEDRWAVVAYLLALQRSQRATLDQTPPEVRARLLEETP